MGLADGHERMLRRLISERSVKLTLRGRSVSAARGRAASEYALSDYGVTAGYSMSLRVLLSDLDGVAPESGQIAIVSGTEYRILEPVEIDSFGVSALIHLGSKAK